jgi:hypothetical protein
VDFGSVIALFRVQGSVLWREALDLLVESLAEAAGVPLEQVGPTSTLWIEALRDHSLSSGQVTHPATRSADPSLLSSVGARLLRPDARALVELAVSLASVGAGIATDNDAAVAVDKYLTSLASRLEQAGAVLAAAVAELSALIAAFSFAGGASGTPIGARLVATTGGDSWRNIQSLFDHMDIDGLLDSGGFTDGASEFGGLVDAMRSTATTLKDAWDEVREDSAVLGSRIDALLDGELGSLSDDWVRPLVSEILTKILGRLRTLADAAETERAEVLPTRERDASRNARIADLDAGVARGRQALSEAESRALFNLGHGEDPQAITFRQHLITPQYEPILYKFAVFPIFGPLYGYAEFTAGLEFGVELSLSLNPGQLKVSTALIPAIAGRVSFSAGVGVFIFRGGVQLAATLLHSALVPALEISLPRGLKFPVKAALTFSLELRPFSAVFKFHWDMLGL